MKHLLISVLLFSVFGRAELANAPARHFGVPLLPGSKVIEENRFQSSRTYEDTKKHFHNYFRNSKSVNRMGDEINLPHVRATLYETLDKKSPFYGINIYLNGQTGVTEIFFLVNTTRDGKP